MVPKLSLSFSLILNESKVSNFCIIVGFWRYVLAGMWVRRGVYRVLVGNIEGKKPLGRATRRWEDNILMDFQEVGCGDVDWMAGSGYGLVA